MLVLQILLVVVIGVLGALNPAEQPYVVALAAFAVTLASASQDIVLDAYRRESLVDQELGLGTAIFVNGYRVAMLVSGALALFLADIVPWNIVYWAMAAIMLVGVITTLVIAEPVVDAPSPRTIREAVVEPFVDFFRRPGAWLVLAFVLLYKIGDQMAASMTTPFILDLGFTKTELAAIAKVFGMGALIGGAFLGGVLMLRISIIKALWLFGIFQAAAVLGYALLAQTGKVPAILALAIAAENLGAGMGSSAQLAYMASLTNKRYSATQYALMSSLMGIPRVFASAPTGYIAHALGWFGYFIFCTLAAVPGLLVLALLTSRKPISSTSVGSVDS
jgi:PAT family beta-lactamase induction signal transducer AmpG